jgi:hypothetical protein
MNWKFLVRRFTPDLPPDQHKIIETYVNREGAHRRADTEDGFHYVQPVNIVEPIEDVIAKLSQSVPMEEWDKLPAEW